jgi:hypothetical protein
MWKTPRTVLISGAALVVGLGVGAAIVPAMAAQEPVLTEEQQAQLSQQSDAYKACLEEQGVTLPEKPADGTRPEITDEQKAAMRAAHDACSNLRPTRPVLSEEQQATLKAQVEEYRACLTAQGVTPPERPAAGTVPQDGTRPFRPAISDEQRAAMAAARDACADVAPNLGGRIGGPGFGHGPGGAGRGPGSATT